MIFSLFGIFRLCVLDLFSSVSTHTMAPPKRPAPEVSLNDAVRVSDRVSRPDWTEEAEPPLAVSKDIIAQVLRGASSVFEEEGVDAEVVRRLERLWTAKLENFDEKELDAEIGNLEADDEEEEEEDVLTEEVIALGPPGPATGAISKNVLSQFNKERSGERTSGKKSKVLKKKKKEPSSLRQLDGPADSSSDEDDDDDRNKRGGNFFPHSIKTMMFIKNRFRFRQKAARGR